MTPDEIAHLLMTTYQTPDFEQTLAKYREQLSYSVIQRIIFNGVHKGHRKNLQAASNMVDLCEILYTFQKIPRVKVLIKYGRGAILIGQNQYEEGIQKYAEAAEISRELENYLDLAILQSNQVAPLREMGRYNEAIELASQARLYFQSNKKFYQYLSLVEGNVAGCYAMIGQLDKAYQSYENALSIAKNMNDLSREASICNNYAQVLLISDRLEKAEELLLRGYQIYLQQNFHVEVARIEGHIGEMAFRKGQYQRALIYLEQSHTGFANLNLPIEVASVDLLRSHIYRALNLHFETIRTATNAEWHLRRSKLPYYRLQAQINAAIGHKELGELDKAEQVLNKARRLAYRTQHYPLMLEIDIERAYLAIAQNNYKRAKAIASSALKRTDAHLLPRFAVRLYILLTRHTLNTSKPTAQAKAFYYLEQAKVLTDQYDLKEERISVTYLQGKVGEKWVSLSEAWEKYKLALAQIEEFRNMLSVDDFLLGFLVAKENIYQASVALCHKLHQLRQVDINTLAFALNLLHTAPLQRKESESSSKGKLRANVTLDKLRQEWHWLQNKVNTRDQEQNSEIIDYENLRERIKHIETRIVELTRRIQLKSTDYLEDNLSGDLFGDTESWLESIKENLQPHQALLHFYIIGEDVHALLIDKHITKVVTHLVPNEQIIRIQKMWELHLQTISQGSGVSLEKRVALIGSRLYELLWLPLESFIETKSHLFLVLPTVWHTIPMAMCFDGKAPLCGRLAFSYLTSPQSLVQEASKEHTGSTETNASALVVGYSDNNRLTYTLSEAQAVHDALSRSYKATFMLEKSANLTKFQTLYHTQKIIHIATHAVFRPDNPYFSWIQFADERFTLADLNNMRFQQAPMVVLSTCEMGKGKPSGGGLIGMGRGFLTAGASAVLLSLWPLEDKSSAQFMIKFYELLQEGHAPASALSLTQQNLREQFPHPFFWAGFILIEG